MAIIQEATGLSIPPESRETAGPPYPHRQSAGAGGGIGVDIGGKIPDLYVDHHLGSVHIRLDVGEGLVEFSAHKLGQLNGGHGKGLIRPFGFHLKGAGGHQVVPEVGFGGFQNGLGGFLTGLGPGEPHCPEQAAEGFKGPVQVTAGLLGLHVGDGLAGVDAELAVWLQSATALPMRRSSKVRRLRPLRTISPIFSRKISSPTGRDWEVFDIAVNSFRG